MASVSGNRRNCRQRSGGLEDELPRLRHEHGQLMAALGPLRAEAAGLAGQHAHAAALRAELQQLQGQRDALAAAASEADRLTLALARLRAEHAELSGLVVETRETAILQEAGVYQYRHPLRTRWPTRPGWPGSRPGSKMPSRPAARCVGSTNWPVNGSAGEGAEMVRDFSKLMLRAYNAEADNCVRSMKPYTLESASTGWRRPRETIAKLGSTMSIHDQRLLPPAAGLGARADRRLPGQGGGGEGARPRATGAAARRGGRAPRDRAGARTAPQGGGPLPHRASSAARPGRRRRRGQELEAKLAEIRDAVRRRRRDAPPTFEPATCT